MRERKLNRLRGYDYSKNNLYFVTSCVDKRVHCFGEVKTIHTAHGVSHQMMLNEYGEIAERQWYWLAEQYAYVVLHAFVVMPDHIHGIIEINRDLGGVRTGRDLSVPDLSVPDLSVQKIKSLSEIMGAYKTTTSKWIHLAGCNEFKWQRSFHDHIIRDERSYQRISNYILNNPQKWKEDKFPNSIT